MTLTHPGGELFSDVPYPPDDWHFIDYWERGHVFRHKCGLCLIIDCEEKTDGKRWVHVSVSRKDWDPSHLDMMRAKLDFLGDHYAYSVYPPDEKYVNVHKHCLHLWALAEGDGRALPEFSEELPAIGRSI